MRSPVLAAALLLIPLATFAAPTASACDLTLDAQPLAFGCVTLGWTDLPGGIGSIRQACVSLLTPIAMVNPVCVPPSL